MNGRPSTARDAIAPEKLIKAWRHSPNVTLIDRVTPEWTDIGVEWSGRKDAM
jgi:hypothetical protein